MTDMKSTERFSDRVDAYVAARPSYPGAVATLLAQEYALKPAASVADLGCGTGLSCVPFLRAGFTVIGIEPNDAMREAGDAFLAGQGTFTLTKGTAEATGLPDASVDLVIAAQAAHWFDTARARVEARRILRRPVAALIWNDRDTESTPFERGYEQLMHDFGKDYAQIRNRHGAEPLVTAFFGHGNVRESRIPNPSRLDWPRLLARVVSSSYMPQVGQPGYAPMERALRALFEANEDGGTVPMDHVTRVFHGEIAE